MNFHETWNEYHSTGGKPMFALLNFLPRTERIFEEGKSLLPFTAARAEEHATSPKTQNNKMATTRTLYLGG
jgi:hypothetical protein